MRQPDVPFKCVEFSVEFVWKSATFDRMQQALKSLAVDKNSLSALIHSRILGHEIAAEEELRHTIKAQMPKRFSVPNLAELNHSQITAIKTVQVTIMCLYYSYNIII